MSAVTGSTVGDFRHAVSVHDAVKTRSVGRQPQSRKPQPSLQDFIFVALGASGDYVLGVNERSWVLRASDDMFAVTVSANGRFFNTFSPRLPVNASAPFLVNSLVTLTTSLRELGSGDF